jgi:hypothetical protein
VTDKQQSTTESPITTVHALRRRWKPIKEGEASSTEHDSIRIRLHRCLSWMARIEDLEAADLDTDDAVLIYRWIALNALYGRWNDERREPDADGWALDQFLKRIFERDHDGRLESVLLEHKKLAESIVSDEHLNRHYWSEPGDSAAQRARSGIHRVRAAYREKRYRAVMDMTLDRIYLARCQLVHGGATYSGRLNRTGIRRCALMLGHLLVAFGDVIIDGAWRDDWGGICYPPEG